MMQLSVVEVPPPPASTMVAGTAAASVAGVAGASLATWVVSGAEGATTPAAVVATVVLTAPSAALSDASSAEPLWANGTMKQMAAIAMTTAVSV
jgi:hypothetical protein